MNDLIREIRKWLTFAGAVVAAVLEILARLAGG